MSSQARSGDKVVVTDQEASTELSDKHSRWKVNRQLLPLKMYYFFFYGASGSLIPFITVYLKYLRLNASEAGLITGLSMLLAMLMRAVIGMLADKLSAKKTALLICCLGFGTAFFAMWFVPRRILLLELPENSTRSRYVSQQDQLHFHAWICMTGDGQEICRYPASLDSHTCKIIEGKTLALNSGYQSNDGNLTSNSEKYITKNLDVPKNDEADVSQDPNDVPRSDVNDKIRDEIHLTQAGSFADADKTTPCFYVDSETTIPRTDDTNNQRLEKTLMQRMENERTQESNSSEVKPRLRRKLHDEHPIPPEGVGATKGRVTCLLNCIRRLVSNLSDESSDVVLKQTNASARPRRGAYDGVTPDLVFLLSFLLLITGKSLYSASTSLVDAVAYTILGPYSLKWGQQRLWGTVGTSVAVMTITIINDSRQVESFTGLFVACMGLSILAFLTGLFKLRADKAPKNKTFFKDLKKLLSSGAVRLFLCKLLFYGMLAGTAQNFIFWFLVDLGSGQITLGVCLLLYCVSSVILLRCSRFVLHKLGQINVMYITLVAFAIRYLVLSFLTNAWLALPAEILHGVTYSLFWAAASSTASIVAFPGTQATSQGLAGAMYWDLGRGVGIVIAGQFLQLFGARWTFRVYSMVCIAVLPLFWILDRTWPLQKPQTGKGEDSKEQDGEVGEHLLKSGTMNGFPLNNNADNSRDLNNDAEKGSPATHDDNENINASEMEIRVTENKSVVQDSKMGLGNGGLGTDDTDKLQDLVTSTSSSEENSRKLSNTSGSSKLGRRFSHFDENSRNKAHCDTENDAKGLNQALCDTEPDSKDMEHRSGNYTDVTNNSSTSPQILDQKSTTRLSKEPQVRRERKEIPHTKTNGLLNYVF